MLLSTGTLGTNQRNFTRNTKFSFTSMPQQWRHNGRDGVSNHQPHHFYATIYSCADQGKYRSSAPVAFVRGIHRDEFPAQMTSNAENVSIWWRHHAYKNTVCEITRGWLVNRPLMDSQRYTKDLKFAIYHAVMIPLWNPSFWHHHQSSDIRGTLVGNNPVHHSDVFGAQRVGASPIASSFST